MARAHPSATCSGEFPRRATVPASAPELRRARRRRVLKALADDPYADGVQLRLSVRLFERVQICT